MPPVESIPVQTSSAEYSVWCGRGVLSRARELISAAAKDFTGVFFISSPRVWRLWGRAALKSFGSTGRAKPILFDDRETKKRLATVESICRTLVRAGADRKALLVAVGGGVVGDVAGFAAASYLRGIRLVHVPTTLVAQLDSAIGGKTGVNLPEGKNLVGAFYPPSLVLVDPEVLRSLPGKQFRSGLYEVIKYGIIADTDLFRFLEGRMEGLLRQEREILEWVMPHCIRVKANVVSWDEREGGLRQSLNLGHTLGHALEAATGFRRFLHGEAVAWGMLAAAQIAVDRGSFAEEDARRIARIIRRVGMLPPLRGIAPGGILRAMSADKKSRAGKILWVLPRRIGEVEIGVEVPEAIVRKAITRLPQILASAQEGL